MMNYVWAFLRRLVMAGKGRGRAGEHLVVAIRLNMGYVYNGITMYVASRRRIVLVLRQGDKYTNSEVIVNINDDL